jgi:ribonuclease P protein component
VSAGKILIFPPDYRLLARSDFLRTWDKGRRYHTDHFIVVVMQKINGPTRLGVTASKKVGGAVQRNRVKRLVREFFRRNYEKLNPQIDISIIAKKGASDLKYDAVFNELKKLLTV